MKTFDNLKEEIARINNIDVAGFDNDWMLRKFARDQALVNIALIRPYTDKYELIVRFLATGKYAYAARNSAADAADAADAVADSDAADAANAAYYSTCPADAATAVADSAAFATASSAPCYAKAIEGLNALANEYLGLLQKEGEQ